MLITHDDLLVFNVFGVISRRICSIIFPRTEKQLKSLLFIWTFLLVFLSPAYITHGRKLTSVLEAFVASGGLSDFWLICLFFPLWILLARHCLSKVWSFQTQGNTDLQFLEGKTQRCRDEKYQAPTGRWAPPTQPYSVADTMMDKSCCQILRTTS